MLKQAKKILFVIPITVIILGGASIPSMMDNPIRKIYPLLPLTSKNIINFVMKHRDKESIIVDKENHLLYYLRYGKVVKNDYWNGRFYSFPLPIAIGMGGRYETPEGEYIVDGKNPYSRFTKFLKFSVPSRGDPYGIHAGRTYLAKYFEKLELKNPKEKYVTKKDDTRGCVAVETLVMKYLFEKIQVKTPILIY